MSSSIPDFKIRINDTDLPQKALIDLQSVTIEEDSKKLSMFSLVFYNWDREKLRISWSDSPLFAIGNKVEIWLGYLNRLEKVMVAEITSLEPSFQAAEPPMLTVRGYDYRHRLTRGSKTRVFLNMKDSAIAGQVARDAGLRVNSKDSGVTLSMVAQHNQTDWEFLGKRAEQIGYEVYVRDRVLYFQPPQSTSKATIKLSLDRDIIEFSPRLTSMNQVKEVLVRGWDPKEKKVITAKAGPGRESSLMGGKTSGPKKASAAFGKSSRISVDLPVSSQAEAERIALGRFNELALNYIEGDALANGQPKLHAAMLVDIEGAGKTFSGSYYVTSVTHSMTPEEGYMTRFSVQRNAS